MTKPISLEEAEKWCREHTATVDFCGGTVEVGWTSDGWVESRFVEAPTFLAAVATAMEKEAKG